MKKVIGYAINNVKNREYKNVRTIVPVQSRVIENYSDVILQTLEKYANEIQMSILPYNKKSCEETMMIKGLRKSNQETTNRKTHMELVEGVAVQIAKKVELNVRAS